VGEDAGSKLAKARQLGVKIVDEGEFRRLVRD
jgi:NAD-dependent DNA ligase